MNRFHYSLINLVVSHYTAEKRGKYQVVSNQTFQTVQFIIQVFLTGLLIGLFRAVIPALSETEFNVARDSYLLLASFVIAFGVVKSIFNLQVGKWANQYGRKPMLILGWVSALPIPILLFYADSWAYIVAATILLGVQQGLCWSISQIAKLDITPRSRHGLIMGINEFMGYVGVALGGYLSAELVTLFGLHISLLASGAVIIIVAMILSVLACEETVSHALSTPADGKTPVAPNEKRLFATVSFSNRSTSAICTAGLVEKFIDVLVWIVFPAYLYRKGVSLPLIGMITGSYAFTWGGVQLLSGMMANKVGLKWLINAGNVICGVGAMVIWLSDNTFWWFLHSTLIGLGMGLLYPTLGTAMSLSSTARLRAPTMGIYRFWRDFGYAVGSTVVGIGALLIGDLEPLFVLVGGSMLAVAVLVHIQYKPATEEM